VSEERLVVEIRDAFDQDYEPNRGLEDRVVAAIPWEEPRPLTLSRPRLAGTFAALLAVVMIVILVGPTVLTRLNIMFPGFGGSAEPPAYSLAAVTPDSLFVVQRGGAPENALLQSPDGGHMWIDRLHFKGIYDGMQMYGQDGFIWAIDMDMSNCSGNGGACQPPSQHVALHRTWDGGATWTQLPDPGVAVNGVFFVDALHGWIDSGSPATGLSSDVLYATADGGRIWKLIGPLPHSAPMGWVYGVGNYHVTFSSNSDGSFRGWYLGNASLFTSTDGGHSWQPLAVAPSPSGWTAFPSQPVFTGRNGVLPVAYRDPKGPDNATANQLYFFITHDGGVTWSAGRPAPTGFAPVGDIVSIVALDGQYIWLTSQSLTGGDNVQVGPAVARSTDGGLIWTVTPHTPRILQMTFDDATRGFALDVSGDQNVNGILSTSDGGASWQRVNVPVFG
jgi:photosystem II stability/assembly factor-like uncharacterized protein